MGDLGSLLAMEDECYGGLQARCTRPAAEIWQLCAPRPHDGSIAYTQISSLNVKIHGMDEVSKVPNQLFPGDYKTVVAAPKDEHRTAVETS